jgi:hypothetical protein
MTARRATAWRNSISPRPTAEHNPDPQLATS